MSDLERKVLFSGAVTGLGILISILILALRIQVVPISVILPGTIIFTAWAASLWIRAYRKLAVARVIVESQILHIRPVITNDWGGDGWKPHKSKDVDVFISCFGVLLDSRVIQFDYDGIQLKAVEFGPDYVSFTYGKEIGRASCRERV